MVKKVLILAYFYPPCNMPGANRPYGWAKYLPEFGYYPVVITRNWDHEIKTPVDMFRSSGTEIVHEMHDDHEIYYVPYKQNLRDRLYTKYGDNGLHLLRKALTFGELVLQNFFNGVSPFYNLYQFADRYLKEHPEIDLVLTTGAPYTLFKYAHRLKKRHRIEWIADYRDDWNTSEFSDEHNRTNAFLKFIERRSERRWVGSAMFHTAVSPNSVAKNEVFLNKKGYTIHNGYIPEEFAVLKDIEPFQKFTITFIGTLYPTQDIEMFLSAFKKFIALTGYPDNIQLLFPGLAYNEDQEMRVKKALTGFELYYSATARIPKMEILNIEHRTHAFLYCAHNLKGIIGSKIYEYVGLGKPVLFCPSDKDTIEEIFISSGVGFIGNSEDEVLKNLHLLYNNYLENQQRIVIGTNQKVIEHYSRRTQTMILAQLLDQYRSSALQSSEKQSVNASSMNSLSQAAYWNARPYQQCTRCVMDTSDPDINFDKNGVCNHCTEYYSSIKGRTYQGSKSDEQLQALVTDIKAKGRGHAYDVVVGISGGVDSIYTALLAQQHGLRVLAVHLDNGWNSELAVKNIEKILNKLNIDLHTEVLDWSEFRDLQLAFLKASVPEAETPTDIAIPAVLHKFAARYGVKYILSGGNFATEGILPKSWHYDAKDVTYLKAIHKRFGTGRLKTFPTFGFLREARYKVFNGIRMVYPLNLVPYNKKETIRILEQELDWKNYGGKHHESLYTKWVQSYLLPEKFGIDYRRATFSTQICAGEITRDEALEELKKPPYDKTVIRDENEYLAKKLGINPGDLGAIVKLPPKCYRDYPNRKKWLEMGYAWYRKLRG